MNEESRALENLKEHMPADAGAPDCKSLGCAISRVIGYAHDKYKECEDLKGELEFYRENIELIDYRGIADGLVFLNASTEGGHGLRTEYIERLLEPLAILYRDYLARAEESD